MGRCVTAKHSGEEAPAVIAPAMLSDLPEPAVLPITEMEEVDRTIDEPVLEEADAQPSAPNPEPTTENQTEPASELPPPLEPETSRAVQRT